MSSCANDFVLGDRVTHRDDSSLGVGTVQRLWGSHSVQIRWDNYVGYADTLTKKDGHTYGEEELEPYLDEREVQDAIRSIMGTA